MRPLRLAAILLALTAAHLVCTKVLQTRADAEAPRDPSLRAPTTNDAERPTNAAERNVFALHEPSHRGDTQLDDWKGKDAHVLGRAGAPGGAGALAAAASLEAGGSQAEGWRERLARLLDPRDKGARTDARAHVAGEVGVYVRELRSGEEFGLRSEESWYFASGVKVPVALALLQKRERGILDLDTQLRLESGDRVDGTGSTNGHPVGALLRVDYLLEQMLVYSDNTATDMLIRAVGLDEVNRVARELSGRDFAITTLAEVRRRIYSGFHARGEDLRFADWVLLRRIGEFQRVASVGRLLGVPVEELSAASVEEAYDRYYGGGFNSAPLSAYGELLAQIAAGKALGAEATAYLLGVMSRVRTGTKRLPASLPAGLVFAHKTGTQYRRVCDFGLTLGPGGAPLAAPRADVVIAACARGFRSNAAAERALRQVGEALTRCGVLDTGYAVAATPKHSGDRPQSPHEPRREDEPAQVARRSGAVTSRGSDATLEPDLDEGWAARSVDLGASGGGLHVPSSGDTL